MYVTSRESVSGRRRVYKGPASRPGVIVTRQQQELNEALVKSNKGRARQIFAPAKSALPPSLAVAEPTVTLKRVGKADWRRRGADGRYVKHGRHHPA